MSSVLFLCIVLVFLVDQVCKVLVVSRLAVGGSVRLGWLTIRHRPNTCRGFWLRGNRLVPVFVWGLALAGAVIAIESGHFLQQAVAQAALGAALGGAAGNLYDRLRRGAVTDYVDLGWWPVFNFADVAITLGALTAIALLR